MKRINGGTMVLALAAIAMAAWGALCMSGCASREDIQQGLEFAQVQSDRAGEELDRLQGIHDAVSADMENFAPGTQEHRDLSSVLRETQRAIDQIRAVKAEADNRIAGYLAELAEIPEDAQDWQVTGRLAGKALKEESDRLPYPWNWIAYGAGSVLATVSTVGWARSRKAVVEIVGGFEDGKRYNPQLAEEMDAASPMIRAGQSASTKAIVAKAREKVGAAKPKPVAEA